MAEAELSNLKDVERLTQEFRITHPSDLLTETIFKQTNRLSL
jgi:hypothetical protein